LHEHAVAGAGLAPVLHDSTTLANPSERSPGPMQICCHSATLLALYVPR
jgi:hypothetical protein